MSENFRESVRRIVPVWLSDRPGLNVGFRFLWAMAAILDMAMEAAVQAIRARFPGIGTPTALPQIGADRRTLRSPADTDTTFAARLLRWLLRWAKAGSALQLAKELQDYISSHPKIRIYNRAGIVVTLNTDGTSDVCTPYRVGDPGLVIGTSWVIGDNGCGVPAWDWDSVSHPEREAFWSEIWIVLYDAYPEVDREIGAFTIGADAATNSLRQTITQSEVAAVRAVLDDFKAAHTFARALIFTSDDTDFDPEDPGTLQPDGTWGDWNNVAYARPEHLRIWETV